MREFLRENWVWFAAPFVVAGVVVLALLLLRADGGDSPFIYRID